MKEKKEDGVSPSHNRLTWSDQVELEVKVLIIIICEASASERSHSLIWLNLTELIWLRVPGTPVGREGGGTPVSSITRNPSVPCHGTNIYF